MLRTTPILYCKRAALHHVRTAHPILVTIGPPSSSKGLGDEATRALASAQEGVVPRGYIPGTHPCLEPDRFRLRMGATLEKRSGSEYTTSRIYVPGPTPFLREGGFQATWKTQLAIAAALPAHTC